MPTTAEIYLGETDEPEFAVTRKNTATGAEEAATGLTLTVYYAATKTGSAIHSTMSATMTERSSTPGTYYARITGSDKTTQLTAYLNQTIWRRTTGADVNIAEPVVVRQARDL